MSELQVYGELEVEFTVRDKKGAITKGKGYCYITDSSDICGMCGILLFY